MSNPVLPFYLPKQLRREALRLQAKASTLDGRAEREAAKPHEKSASRADELREVASRKRRLAATLIWLAFEREHVAECRICGSNVCKEKARENAPD